MKEKRIVWMDYARAFAVICVVLCHAVETYYRPVVMGEESIELGLWILQNSLFTLGRMGVPIFLALTGALMLGRELNVKSFYLHHFLPLLITTEIWIVANFYFMVWLNDAEFKLDYLIRQMLFVEPQNMGHMWYMPMILSFYIVMPFLSRIVLYTEKNSEYNLWFFIGFLVLVAVPTVNVFLTEAFEELPVLNVQLDTSAFGGLYLLYMFAGYMLGKKEVLAKLNVLAVLALGIVSFVLNCLAQRYLYEYEIFENNKLLSYSSAGIFLSGLCIFELIRRIFYKKQKCGWLTRCLAASSFGIYLLHKPIQNYINVMQDNYFIELFHLPDTVMAHTWVLFFVSLVISFFVVVVVSFLIPPLGRLIFFTKNIRPKRNKEKEVSQSGQEELQEEIRRRVQEELQRSSLSETDFSGTESEAVMIALSETGQESTEEIVEKMIGETVVYEQNPESSENLYYEENPELSKDLSDEEELERLEDLIREEAAEQQEERKEENDRRNDIL